MREASPHARGATPFGQVWWPPTLQPLWPKVSLLLLVPLHHSLSSCPSGGSISGLLTHISFCAGFRAGIRLGLIGTIRRTSARKVASPGAAEGDQHPTPPDFLHSFFNISPFSASLSISFANPSLALSLSAARHPSSIVNMYETSVLYSRAFSFDGRLHPGHRLYVFHMLYALIYCLKDFHMKHALSFFAVSSLIK